MRIAMLHGYLLHGSGSNIYVQNVTKELARLGHEVYLFCQERHPEHFSFIKKAIRIENGRIEEYYSRDTPADVILINPELELLPVYVMDKYPEFKEVKLFIDLSRKELEEYINRNLSALSIFFDQYRFDIVHANHLVMMPYLASRLWRKYQIPYIVTPHGSSLVYTIQKDPRYEEYAIEGLRNAAYVIPGNLNFRDRLLQFFRKNIPNLEEKMRIIPLGVDTKLFAPVSIEKRGSVLLELSERLAQTSRGKTKKDELEFLSKISKMKKELIDEILRNVPSYSQKAPDELASQKVKRIDPAKDRVLTFFGRLIVGKGIHNFAVAVIPLLAKYPNLKVLIIGAGPMREWCEWIIHAGSNGNVEMLKALIDWGRKNFRENDDFWNPLNHFFSTHIEEFHEYKFDASRVIFTGFLDHTYLAPLLSLTEIACFPSLVPESFGLVLVEAAACGVIPVASYFSGFKEILDQFKEFLPSSVFPLLTLPISGPELVPRLIENISRLIKDQPPIMTQLREAAIRKFSWESVATKLEKVYLELVKKR